VPGTVLGKRFRVVAALGKGGMGEVYRADDLALGQPVALKFLPARLAGDPDRLARFRQEVALARRVSHPNACRVWDIGEHDGQPFLAMEYIDGEDLASLLRRVGRLPQEKGVDIARQLSLALAAVHDQGLLHRDLKPQNVMLDGRGKVRLTDFGLAAAVGEIRDGDAQSGTPLYMAPEQLSGKGVTARSDLFALGLVLYELFTGKRAFPAASLEELRRLYDQAAPPSKPSSHVRPFDPAVERAILQCLESDPANRPRSAYEVLAALPGGDPLRAALAAGETPSPQLVADAGGVGAIRPWVGLLLLAGVAAGLTAVAFLNNITLVRFVPMDRPPEDMARRAGQVLVDLGYADPPKDRVFAYRYDFNHLDRLLHSDALMNRATGPAAGQPAVVYFFYRQSPEWLALEKRTSWETAVTTDNPPPVTPGMAEVRLDPLGRLTYLSVVPPPDADASPAEPDWAALFRAAGLELARFEPDTPKRVAPGPFDRRAAWVGESPNHPGQSVRVEAAAWAGRPVSFLLLGDWTPPGGETPVSNPPAWALVLFLAPLVGGLLLAARNLIRRRADWRGALRVGVFVVAAEGLSWLLSVHHVPDYEGERRQLELMLGGAVIPAGLTALLFLAMEPFLRRRWPWQLTGLNRLLAGRWRDSLVGRDLLVGLLAGVASPVIDYGSSVLPALFGRAGAQPLWVYYLAMPGSPNWLGPASRAIEMAPVAIAFALFLNIVVFLLALVLRKPALYWVAFIAIYLLMDAGFASSPPANSLAYVQTITASGLKVLLLSIVMARFGLLSLASMFWGSLCLQAFTWEPPAWYFGEGLVGAGIVLALAVFGFATATAGQWRFRKGFFGDE
jgi:serine/threonine-protein kinase